MSVDERARSAGLGTVQVFQESTDVATGFGRLVERRRSQRRSRAGAVAVAVVAVVLVVFAMGGSFSNDAVPEPMDRHVPQGPFDYVSAQGTTVEVRDATGTLRWSGDLRRWGLTTDDVDVRNHPSLSNAGWLSLSTDRGKWLVDLTDVTSDPKFIAGYWDCSRWSPDGRWLAAMYDENTNPDDGGWSSVIVDPATAEVTDWKRGFTGGCPDAEWAADSSGILTKHHGQLFIAPLDGGPLQQTTPALWGPIDEDTGLGGQQLTWTQRKVVVEELDGTRATWFEREPSEEIVWASFTADARAAIVMLQSQLDPSRATVVRVDGSTSPEVMARLRIDGEIEFFTLAPDDSSAWLYVNESRSFVLPLGGASPTLERAPRFGGWVTDALIDDLDSSGG